MEHKTSEAEAFKRTLACAAVRFRDTGDLIGPISEQDLLSCAYPKFWARRKSNVKWRLASPEDAFVEP